MLQKFATFNDHLCLWCVKGGSVLQIRAFLARFITGGHFKQFKNLAFALEFQRSFLNEFTTRIVFFFDRQPPKYTLKTVKKYKCIMLTLCKLSYFFLFGWILRRFLSCIIHAASRHFVRLLDRVAHRKRPKSSVSTHRMARYLTKPYIRKLWSRRTDFGSCHIV